MKGRKKKYNADCTIRAFNLTNECYGKLTVLSKKVGTSRSEFLNRLIAKEYSNFIQKYQNETQEDINLLLINRK